MLRWLRRRFRRVPAQWVDPRKRVQYTNPFGTTDVIIAITDNDYNDVMVTFDIDRDHINIYLPQDYDETKLTVKVHG